MKQIQAQHQLIKSQFPEDAQEVSVWNVGVFKLLDAAVRPTGFDCTINYLPASLCRYTFCGCWHENRQT
jgi:hypothetical protein